MMVERSENSETLRAQMIQTQIIARGIRDEAVLRAMQSVPRELFVPDKHRGQAYDDKALPVGPGQTISQPFIVAYMSHKLQVESGHRVLEVGTGTGYQTAILAQLSGDVYTVELDAALSRLAAQRLERLGLCRHVVFRSGDGVVACRDAAPFDRILVTAGSESIPEQLVSQLAENGLMIIPVGRGKTQMMLRIRMRKGVRVEQSLLACRFVPLIDTGGCSGQPEG
ncbi:MAG: protein-L-isoaspartate(D-aspartate) O-methyltransferase [Planctomycetes bacterium]|nr:protein-L-isoaspartate(D-aspartate) O-methyltransferase [Planctomycetota bacterium]